MLLKTVILLVYIHYVICDEYPDLQNRCVDITLDDIESNKFDCTYCVMYYLPWCSPCNRAKPHWINAAESNETCGATIGLFDCSPEKHRKFCRSITRRVPHIACYPDGNSNGVVFDQNKDKSTEQFIKFIQQSACKTSTTAESTLTTSKATAPDSCQNEDIIQQKDV